MKKLFYALIAGAFFASASSAATLMGSQVTLTVDYPNLSTPITVPKTQTVGPGVEFPSGSLQVVGGSSIIGLSVDVGASSIALDYTQSAPAATGAFNGYVLDFAGAPTITGVSLDPLSTFTAGQVGLGFDSNEVRINISGLDITSSSRILVDTSFAANPTAPEPQAYALFLTGLGAVGFVMRRKLYAHA